jgi:signal transduction histidine kinase
VAGGCVLTVALVVGVTAAVGWDRDHPWQAATPRLAHVAVFGFVAVWAMQRPATARFGRVLLVVGLLFAVTSLSGSSNPWLYTIGRLVVPLAEVGLIYAALAFPYGRLVLRRDRLLMATLACAVVVLWTPAVVLNHEFLVGGPLVQCGDRCPANVLAVSQQTTVASGLSSLVFLVLFGCLLGAAGSLVKRYRDTSPVLRRRLLVGTCAGVAYSTVLASYAALAALIPHAQATTAIGWLVIAANLVIPIAFLVALLHGRLIARGVLLSLLRELMVAPDAVAFRMAIADVLEDPTLRLAHRQPDGELIDLQGRPLIERTNAGRAVSEVPGTADGLLLVHDPALRNDPEVFEAVCDAAAVAYDQHRQRLRVKALVEDLRSSRERLAVARDTERRRFERDLHDGAQQGFVAAQVRLGIARTRVSDESAGAESALDEASVQLDHAIGQLRDLAHGIYPAALESDGVAVALRVAASSAALRTGVNGADVGRFPREIEAAVYFSCLEAMQNADKHAGSGAHVNVALTRDAHAVRFAVTDDGKGFDPDDVAGRGGLLNIRDRLEPFGGAASINSTRGGGTAVTGWVPVRAATASRQDDPRASA